MNIIKNMAGQASRKVRRVRCPQCWKVLEEPPDVSLYSCGGCGNILQAKNWKQGSDRIGLPTTKSQGADILGKKEIGSLDRVPAGPRSLESSPDKDSVSCQDGLRDCNTVLCEERCIPNVLSKSLEVVACPNEGLIVEDKEPLRQGKLEDEIFVECNNEFCDGHGESTGRSSAGIPSSGEFSHEVEENEPESIEHLEQHNKYYSHENSKGDGIADDCQDLPDIEVLKCVHPSDREHTRVPPEIDEKGRISSSDQKRNSGGGMKLTKQERIFEADAEAQGFLITASSEKKMKVECGESQITSQKPLNENLASCNRLCPEDECLPREHVRDFRKANSMDTLGSLAHADLTSEINVKHESMTNHPTASVYYMYAGSESSYDGNHGQIGARMTSRMKRDVVDLRTTEMLRQDAFRGTNMNRGLERHRHTSLLRRATRSSRWGWEKYAEAPGYASENNLVQDRRTAGFSSNRHNFLPPHQGFSSSRNDSYSELDRMDLLRTVYELEDQLSRMQFPNNVGTRRLMGGKFNPFNDDHLAVEREAYYGQYNIPRPGDVARSRRHISCSCSRCCPPPDLRYLEQLQLPKRSPLQERRYRAKRYVRPVAGAAPFIACYHCPKLLQLPADFLTFKKRRHHQLMCNACKKLLTFSVVQGTRIVPNVPDATARTPSKANSYSRNMEQRYRSGVMQTFGLVGSSSSKVNLRSQRVATILESSAASPDGVFVT